MALETQAAPPSTAAFWAGAIITGLVVLFLIFDGVTKVVPVKPVIEACEKLGIPAHTILGIGTLLLACTALYAFPRTAVLGAILLTGYLGGATAIHVRAGSGVFEMGFSVAFGGLVWAGLLLREPQLLWTIILRH